MKSTWRLIVGAVLLLLGGLLLLENFNMLNFGEKIWGMVVAVAFAAGGAAFLSVLITNREHWWAAIPGMTLFGISAAIIIPLFAPDLGRLSGMAVLGSISLAFWLVYFLQPRNWWAVIPAGVLMTLAVITVFEGNNGLDTGGILFLGIGATFALLGLLPVDNGRPMRWPWIPSGILLLMGAMLLFSSMNLFSLIWPVGLIIGGGFMLFRSIRRR